MEDRLEAHAKIANFEPVCLFDTLREHPDALPILLSEHTIIIGIKSWSLKKMFSFFTTFLGNNFDLHFKSITLFETYKFLFSFRPLRNFVIYHSVFEKKNGQNLTMTIFIRKSTTLK